MAEFPVACPKCDAEEGILFELKITSHGSPGSYFEPPEPVEWELEGDGKCAECGHVMTQEEIDATEKAQDRLVEDMLSEGPDEPEPDYDRYNWRSDGPMNYPEGFGN